MPDPIDADAVVGCLLGQAVGDMMGLPAENMSPRRIAKLFPTFDRPRFLFGYGMGSDDTEHACLTAQAILRSGGDVDCFRRSLAWRLRWWFAACPAGIGLATAKSCVRLWLGWPSSKSGVRSAGNGPAMRAAILGVCFGNDPARLNKFVEASTKLTHSDPEALAGALLVARVAYSLYCRSELPGSDTYAWFAYTWQISRALPSECYHSNFLLPLWPLHIGLGKGEPIAYMTSEIGAANGVSGYIRQTAFAALYSALRHPDDYRAAIEAVIRCGGDTDTVAAITGALVGARVGKAGIPPEWLGRWADWPRSARWIEALGRRLAEGQWREAPQPAVPLAWWAVPFRNLFFFLVVLVHIGRRLLPPY